MLHSWICCFGESLRPTPQQFYRVWASLEDGESEFMGWAGLWGYWHTGQPDCWSSSDSRETSTPLPCTASSSLCRFIEERGVEGSSPDPLLHVSGVLLPLLAPAPCLRLPVTVVRPALHAGHPIPPGPSLHPCQHIPGRDLKLQSIPTVLEMGKPPPSALVLLAGACVTLRHVGSVATSHVLMLSSGGSGWCCWVEVVALRKCQGR